MGRSFYARTGVEFTDTITPGLELAKEAIRPRVVEAVLAAAEHVRERAHDLANVSPGVIGNAVDGGHMRDKIEIILTDEDNIVSAKIGIDMSIVPYAHHQEFGPNGKPFLRPALDETRADAHAIMKEALNGVPAHTAVRFRRYA